MLKAWFWKDGVIDVTAVDVWQKTCQYLYLPRLASSPVMQSAIAAGATSRDFFGLAYGKDGEGSYKGFSLGQATSPLMDALLLIEPAHAAAYEERTRPLPTGTEPVQDSIDGTPVGPGGDGPAPPDAPPPATPSRPTRYFGTAELDPVKASLQFSKITSELVELFSSTAGTNVRIRVDIEADDSRGFDETTVRAARENGKTLGMKTSDFE
jgi:hypothetical protein